MQTLETALKTIIQDADRLIFRGIEEKYLSDALGRRRGAAEALVFPLNTQEVSSVLRYAHENHVLVAREPIWWAPRYLSRAASSLTFPA